MKYRILGKTGLKIPVIGVGTWQYGGEWGQRYTAAEVRAILDKALELGMNFLDTAECYGDHLSESLIGGAIEGRRDQYILATKFGHKFNAFLEREQRWSAAEVQRQLDDSLRALRTDHIDLYQFHSGTDEQLQNDDLWSMLHKQVEAGKVLHLGLSLRMTGEAFQVEKSARDYGVEALQVHYNRLDRSPEEFVFPVCAQYNIGVLARVPLASGFLSGKYRPGQTFPADDVRGQRGQERIDEQLRQVEEIHRTEVPAGVPMAEWALAWCLKNPLVHCVIPGCKNVAQVESNARASELVK